MERADARVLGISSDAPEDLRMFRAKHELNFPLAGDTSHKVLETYGVWQEKTMYGVKRMGVVRTTYVIDREGRVKRAFPKVKVEGHVSEVLAAITA